MKLSSTIRRVAACLTLLALLLALAVPVFAEIVYPTPTDYIADDAAVLSEQTVKQIKETNANLASEIKAVIAVCTVKSTNGIEIGKYARSLYSEWKLPTGILIVVASEDKSFFLVPSTGVSEVIDNAALEEVRDQCIEDDFAAGRIYTAVRKAVTQLSILMLREMKQDTAPAQSENAPAQTPAATTETTKTEDQGASVGSIIVGILKAILIIALVLLLLFVLLFIVALFNDDVAAIMQKYIFRRGNRTQNNAAYYDDRLYGDQNRNRQRQQNSRNRYDDNYNHYDDRNYGGQGYNNGNGGQTYQSRNTGGRTYQGQNGNGQQSRAQRQVRYDANGNPIRTQNTQRQRPQNQGQTYYNADGTPRTQQPRQQQNYYQANAQRARQQQYQANQAADATRAYTIPGRGNNAR